MHSEQRHLSTPNLIGRSNLSTCVCVFPCCVRSMKQHFTVLSQYEALHGLKESKSSPELHARSSAGGLVSHASHSLEPISDTDRILSLQMALKCADLGHLAAPLDVHLKWVRALEAEFFQQGDEERAAGLPISPLCDSTKEGVTKSQGKALQHASLSHRIIGRLEAEPQCKQLRNPCRHSCGLLRHIHACTMHA